MVRIIKSKISQNADGKPFVSLKLQGDPEPVQSMQTGRMYLTARTCYISTTFDESTANSLIGKELPGTIERIPSEPYEYKVESTGEVITLSHRYEYKPAQVPVNHTQNVSGCRLPCKTSQSFPSKSSHPLPSISSQSFPCKSSQF